MMHDPGSPPARVQRHRSASVRTIARRIARGLQYLVHTVTLCAMGMAAMTAAGLVVYSSTNYLAWVNKSVELSPIFGAFLIALGVVLFGTLAGGLHLPERAK